MHTVQISFHILALLIVLALLFDFMNGFHDAANAIATVVSTGVLRPQTAVAMAAFFNLAAVFVFHQLHVAASVGKGTIDPAVVDHVVVFVESYRPNRVAIRRFLSKLGIEFTMASVHDHASIEREFARAS